MSSIHKHQTKAGSDRWRVMWRDAGKQRGRDFSDESGAEAWRALLDVVGPARALEALNETEAKPGDDRTVAQHIAAHIDGLTGITAGTRRVYHSHLARVIEPTRLGSVPLARVTAADIAAWVNELDSAGRAAKTIANYHGLVSSALNTAVREGLLAANPAAGMRLPRGDHAAQEMVFLTSEQFAALYGAMTPHYRPLVLTLVGTGLRFGEATALRVRDISTVDSSARVTRAWKYTGTAAREIGPPKTSRSTRTVALPPETLAALDLDRAADDLLFVAPKGGAVRQPVFFTSWRKAVSALDVSPRVHDLRHTFASWAIQSGIPLPVIQRQLGHQSITTTVDRYGHLARSDFDALASATSARLSSIRLALPVAPDSELRATLTIADGRV